MSARPFEPRGIFTAIITPFRDGRVDFAALERIVEHQVEAGVQGVVPVGTTGESATVVREEPEAIFRAVVKAAAGRCQVIAGIGSNCTDRAVTLARQARDCGADAGLTITPYYNKPTQEGLYQHFTAVTEAVPDLPLVLYNVPGRTGVSITAETCVRLAEHDGIVAIKDASQDLAMGAEIVARCGARLALLSGEDSIALPLWAIGGSGVICVTSNVVPERLVEMWTAFEAGDLARARRVHLSLLPLMRALFMETNPAPVKTVVSWLLPEVSDELRRPMVPVSEGTAAQLRAVCAQLEIPLPADPAA